MKLGSVGFRIDLINFICFSRFCFDPVRSKTTICEKFAESNREILERNYGVDLIVLPPRL
jgi:hypothetical protein